MTRATVASFQPVTRMEYLDRLAPLSPTLDVAPELWSAVHEEIQRQLLLLETDVRRKLPGVRVAPGRTHGSGFFFFSHRTFSIPDSAVDPVVAGLTITPADRGMTVEADVSGEQTGDWIASVPTKTVVDATEDLLAAVRESARQLCQFAEAIAAALQDSSRRIE
jgi:hypothetical protein